MVFLSADSNEHQRQLSNHCFGFPVHSIPYSSYNSIGSPGVSDTPAGWSKKKKKRKIDQDKVKLITKGDKIHVGKVGEILNYILAIRPHSDIIIFMGKVAP